MRRPITIPLPLGESAEPWPQTIYSAIDFNGELRLRL
jgi:hypothetical protein